MASYNGLALDNGMRKVANRIARIIASEIDPIGGAPASKKGGRKSQKGVPDESDFGGEMGLDNPRRRPASAKASARRLPSYDAIVSRANALAAEWAQVKNMPAKSRPARWQRSGDGKAFAAAAAAGKLRPTSDLHKKVLRSAHSAALVSLANTAGAYTDASGNYIPGIVARHRAGAANKYRQGTKFERVEKKMFGKTRMVKIRDLGLRGMSREEKKALGAEGRKKAYLASDFKALETNRGETRSASPGWDGAKGAWKAYGEAGSYLGADGRLQGYWKQKPGASGEIILGTDVRGKARGRAAFTSSKSWKADAEGRYLSHPLSKKERSAAGKAAWAAKSPAEKQKTLARLAAGRAARAKKNPGVFGDLGYDGLALSNPGIFGGLALDNSPFVAGASAVGVSALKLIGAGAATALVFKATSSYVDEYLPKLPVIGSYLADLSVPDSVPMIGGTDLKNTVAGAILGGLAIAASHFAGAQLGGEYGSKISQYGKVIGGTLVVIGPVLDILGHNAGETHGLSAADLGGIALDNAGVFGDVGNLGGIALSNTGVFGDGMSYQLGAVSGEDTGYGQASLGDAYYSGADFNVQEGEAMVQGRHAFQHRFGQPAQRIQQHGGQHGASASHMAGQPGHQWGWLVKMIGWSNVERLAQMPPKQRVAILKQLRESALATFKQLSQENQAAALAPDEFSFAGHAGQAGHAPQGASGAYGSTIVGGHGL